MDKTSKLEKELAKEKNPTPERKRIHELARRQLKWQEAMQRMQPDIEAAKAILDKL